TAEQQAGRLAAQQLGKPAQQVGLVGLGKRFDPETHPAVPLMEYPGRNADDFAELGMQPCLGVDIGRRLTLRQIVAYPLSPQRLEVGRLLVKGAVLCNGFDIQYQQLLQVDCFEHGYFCNTSKRWLMRASSSSTSVIRCEPAGM